VSLSLKRPTAKKETMKGQVSHTGRHTDPGERILAEVAAELELRRKRARPLVSNCPGRWDYGLAA